MEKEQQIQQLAAHIHAFFETDKQTSEKAEFAALHRSLNQINSRLDHIEGQLNSQNPKSAIPNPQSEHPSQNRFRLEEFLHTLLNDEKACSFEPNKPCDKCAMCSSRGF